MVAIEVNGQNVVVRVLGLHQVWAFKRIIRFRKDQIERAEPAGPELRPPWCKCPGTALPFVICAGTYFGYKRREFWDRTQTGKGIRIDLKDGPFTRLVVDVEDPEATLARLAPG